MERQLPFYYRATVQFSASYRLLHLVLDQAPALPPEQQNLLGLLRESLEAPKRLQSELPPIPARLK